MEAARDARYGGVRRDIARCAKPPVRTRSDAPKHVVPAISSWKPSIQPSETEIMGAIKQQVSSLQTMEFLKVRAIPSAACRMPCALRFLTQRPPPRPTQTVRDKCYAACIPKPGSSLSSREETCLDNCMDRYADAIKTVTQALNDGKF